MKYAIAFSLSLTAAVLLLKFYHYHAVPWIFVIIPAALFCCLVVTVAIAMHLAKRGR